jgi:hypothetical protein
VLETGSGLGVVGFRSEPKAILCLVKVGFRSTRQSNLARLPFLFIMSKTRIRCG